MVVARKGDRIRLTACCDLFTFELLPLGLFSILMPSYLVTGGAGFIGSHLAEELVRRGHRVRVADSLITGKRRNLAHIPGVDFLEGDLADLSVAQRAVDGMDYVLHQAAIPSVPRSVKDPITSNRANIDASLNVLVAARDAGVKRLVYAGSSSAYGNTPTLPKREDMPANPLSPYALQKLVAEQYGQMFTALYGFEDGDDPVFQRVRPAAGSRLAVLRRHLALRDGAPRRAPADHLRRRRADARLHLRRQRRGRRAARVRGQGAAGEVINVATGGRISLNQLLRVMNGIVGTNLQAIYKEARAGDVKDSQADITKAKTLLGYEPTVSLEEGLKHTLEWCRSGGAAAPPPPSGPPRCLGFFSRAAGLWWASGGWGAGGL